MMRHSTQAGMQARTQARTQAEIQAEIQAQTRAKTRVAGLCAAMVLATFPLASAALETAEAKHVNVLGRAWSVEPAEEAPGFYRATRLNNEMEPFRPPAVLSVRQAIRAIKGATGCSANLDTIYRTISGSYYTTLICPQN
ncbi:hypothetical protein [Pseudophaeobacter leonis]|uniref:hypothetical protein n=1 Tax=Pseudophaeobacter leonis TaxID=1144477 RepID=UPI001F4E4D2A|nr:hypothetical protein [Pseudophaeobacter leonis]